MCISELVWHIVIVGCCCLQCWLRRVWADQLEQRLKETGAKTEHFREKGLQCTVKNCRFFFFFFFSTEACKPLVVATQNHEHENEHNVSRNCLSTSASWRTHIILSEIWHQQWPGYLLICALTGINDSFSGVKETYFDVFYLFIYFLLFCQRAGLSLSLRDFCSVCTQPVENVGDIRAPFLTSPRNLFAVIHARAAWKNNFHWL